MTLSACRRTSTTSPASAVVCIVSWAAWTPYTSRRSSQWRECWLTSRRNKMLTQFHISFTASPLSSSHKREDFRVNIEFLTWPIIRYKREVLFGWVDLLVSFGGIAGLFLGFSLLSGVEIVYYFTMRAGCMFVRNRVSSSCRSQVITDNKFPSLSHPFFLPCVAWTSHEYEPFFARKDQAFFFTALTSNNLLFLRISVGFSFLLIIWVQNIFT